MADSMVTKQAIANGFKDLMHEKRFDKITISDITSRCHLNRQTFYYHFRDKYDLLTWIYHEEAICFLSQDMTFDNWSDRIYKMLQVMKKNDYFYINAFKSSGSEEFESYVHHAIKQMFLNVIDSMSVIHGLSEEDREFIANFYTFGVIGSITGWVTEGMRVSPEALTTRFENLVMGTQRVSVQRWATEHRRRKQQKK